MPGFTKLKLSHSQHPSSILTGLNLLRECNQLFCDCTLIINKIEFPIHKAVLAASSQYFKALFTSGMRESGDSRIALHGISALTFQSVLTFIYTGKLTLDQENVTNVYTAADMLQLEHLQNLCHDFLLNQLCASNCIGIWRYARSFSNSKLEGSAWLYAMTHIKDVKESLEFLYLTEAKPVLPCCDRHDSKRSELQEFTHHVTQRRKGSESLAVEYPHTLAIAAGEPIATIPSLVIVGGYNKGVESTCEKYCTSTDSWEVITTYSLSSCKYFHWVGVIGLRLYAIAGNGLARINLVMSKLTDEAVKDLQTDALCTDWECEATLPHDCSNMKFCIMNDYIYGCGEITDATYAICRYNPSDGTWEHITQFISKPRVFFQFFSNDHKLHLIGGVHTSTGTATACFESYDPYSDIWERNNDMDVGRYNFGVAVTGNCLYAVGGYGSDEVMLSSVEVYSFETGEWSAVSALPTPRASMACQSWGEKMYCLGGEKTTGTNSASVVVQTEDALEFDPPNDKWNKISSLNHPRIYPSTIIL